MKKGWEIKKLAEVCELINGRAYNKNELLTKGKYRVLRVGNFFTNNHWYYSNLELEENKYCDKGDLLYAWSASFGPKIWNQERAIFHYHIWKVIPNKKYVTKEFLYKILEWDVDKIKRDQGTGTTMMHVGKGSMDNREVPIPPILEQKAIVELLDKAFFRIDKSMKNVEKNLDNAKMLFENYLLNIFINSDKDWPMTTLEELTEISRGHNPPKSKFSQTNKLGYVRFYQIRDGWSDNYKVYVPETSKLHTVKPDDILMVAYRHIGKAFRGVTGAFNVALCKISNKRRDILDDDYLFQIITTPFVKGELLKRSERSLIPSMSIEHLKEIKIPLPPLREQLLIVDTLKVLSSKTKQLEAACMQKLELMDRLKKSILQKAFVGELKTKPELTTA